MTSFSLHTIEARPTAWKSIRYRIILGADDMNHRQRLPGVINARQDYGERAKRGNQDNLSTSPWPFGYAVTDPLIREIRSSSK